MKVCKENSCLLDKEITYLNQGVLVNAKVIDILSNGHILLESDGKQYEKSSGEITLHYKFIIQIYKMTRNGHFLLYFLALYLTKC